LGNKRTGIETGIAIERQWWALDVAANVRRVSPWLERQFTNDLDCDPSIRRRRTRARPQQ
jgi:hypothetical protein